MTNTAIKTTIDKANTNKDIRWSIVHNANGIVTLTNDYDKCISYSIRVASFDNEEYILVTNNHLESTVGSFWYGVDYYDLEDGIALGIKTAVRNFNYIY